MTNKDFTEKVQKLTNDEYVPLSSYTSSSEKVLMYHKKCRNNYEVTPNNFFKGRRCPYCAGKIIDTNKTSLQAIWPEILPEWDYNKNIIKPTDITPGSNKKVYWKCKYGHSWEATPNSRKRGIGCPYCYRDKSLKYLSNNNNIINNLLNKNGFKTVADYRINECRAIRPIPFSLAVFRDDKLIGLIDYRNKYYPEDSKIVKKKYCKENKIPYCYLELQNNSFDDKQLIKLTRWIDDIIGGEK